MRAPVLSRKLVLEGRTDLPDGAGGFETTWTALGTIWAEVTPRTGSEVVRAGRDTSRQRFRIVVRGAPFGAPSRPRPDQRFREGDRIYPIYAVTELDRPGHFLICDCEAGALT